MQWLCTIAYQRLLFNDFFIVLSILAINIFTAAFAAGGLDTLIVAMLAYAISSFCIAVLSRGLHIFHILLVTQSITRLSHTRIMYDFIFMTKRTTTKAKMQKTGIPFRVAIILSSFLPFQYRKQCFPLLIVRNRRFFINLPPDENAQFLCIHDLIFMFLGRLYIRYVYLLGKNMDQDYCTACLVHIWTVQDTQYQCRGWQRLKRFVFMIYEYVYPLLYYSILFFFLRLV